MNSMSVSADNYFSSSLRKKASPTFWISQWSNAFVRRKLVETLILCQGHWHFVKGQRPWHLVDSQGCVYFVKGSTHGWWSMTFELHLSTKTLSCWHWGFNGEGLGREITSTFSMEVVWHCWSKVWPLCTWRWGATSELSRHMTLRFMWVWRFLRFLHGHFNQDFAPTPTPLFSLIFSWKVIFIQKGRLGRE